MRTRKLELTPPRLAFIIITRALLAGGIGLLVSSKLSYGARRAIGKALVAFGAATTIPALHALRAAAR
jgi:hypothetical protein